MTDGTCDVIIAGAGPIGLFLSCELALAGCAVTILEQDDSPINAFKTAPLGMRGLMTGSVEALYRRGLLDAAAGGDPAGMGKAARSASFVESSTPFQHGGHFAGIVLNSNKLDLGRWEYTLNGPALVPAPTTIERLESVLTRRAKELGVNIIRGHGVTKIISNDDYGVNVQTTRGKTFHGAWLVGCDGGRSTVRKAGGFDFVGTEPKFTGYAVLCELRNATTLKPGFNSLPNFYVYRQGSPAMLHLADFDNGEFDRSQAITSGHLQDVVRRVTGDSNVEVTEVHVAGAWTDRCKQATTYRRHRILLAGDAAHIHSPLGAQGLNLGIGDALNLGWKLATTIRAEKDSSSSIRMSLLDTYTSERHPVGERIQRWTRAQVSILQPDEHGKAVHELMCDLLDTKDGTNLMLEKMWGVSQRYDLGDDVHPLVGRSVPDFEFQDGVRLGVKMQGGKASFIDFGHHEQLKDAVKCHATIIDCVSMNARNKLGLAALLVRPDGIVAWATEAESSEIDLAAFNAAVRKWFIV